ncbi:MAG TPA: peptidylprolyl isomerase [Candidatus Acidoferrum sp.]|nr:peptidylprolyl isomerase [Candidatus Acidoferrum sp.]
MAMKRIVCFVLAGIIGIGAEASAQAPAQSAAKPQSGAAAKSGTVAKSGSTVARSPYDRALLRPAVLKDKGPASYQVKFSTTRGEFVVTVTRAWAPLGADRFYNLVKHHYYDNASFFRVVPEFVVQFGISAYPRVSAAWKDTNIKDDPVTLSNKKGSLTFATAGPNTRTTQIFINLKDNVRLDSMGFAPFGVVEGKGMNVVEMLYDQYGDNAGPDQDQIQKQGKPYLDKGWPKLDSIKSATLVAPAGAAAAAKSAAAPAPTKP